jgi:hypothetical protein
MTTRRSERWYPIYDNRNCEIAYAEEHDDGWHVYARRQKIGVVATFDAAQELARASEQGGDR